MRNEVSLLFGLDNLQNLHNRKSVGVKTHNTRRPPTMRVSLPPTWRLLLCLFLANANLSSSLIRAQPTPTTTTTTPSGEPSAAPLPLRTAGEACESSADCDSALCIQCFNTAMTPTNFCRFPLQCAPREYEDLCRACLGNGRPCEVGSCVDGNCIIDNGEPLLPRCFCRSDTDCASDRCFLLRESPGGECIAKSLTGDACFQDGDCFSGHCVEYEQDFFGIRERCASGQPGEGTYEDGAFCNDASDCQTGGCWAGICNSGQDGALCTYDEECQNGSCTSSCTLASDERLNNMGCRRGVLDPCREGTCLLTRCGFRLNACKVSASDFVQATDAFFFLLFLAWIAPILYVIRKSTSLAQRAVKVFFALSLPAFTFEVWTSLAAITAAARCREEFGASNNETLALSGYFGIILWAFEAVLWWMGAWYAYWRRNTDSTEVDLEERLWELIQDFMASCLGTVFLLIFGGTASFLIISKMLEYQDDEATGLSRDEAEEIPAITAIFGAVLLIVSCCCCCMPGGFVQRVSGIVNGSKVNDADEDGPTRADFSRFRLRIVKLFLLDFGGFVIGVVNSEWTAIIFAVDELYSLARILGVRYGTSHDATELKDQYNDSAADDDVEDSSSGAAAAVVDEDDAEDSSSTSAADDDGDAENSPCGPVTATALVDDEEELVIDHSGRTVTVLPKEASNATEMVLAEQETTTTTTTQEQVHRNVWCDGCGKGHIRGFRFTCAECEDYDLCQACHEITHVHHAFRQYERSGSPSFVSVVAKVPVPVEDGD